MFWDKKKRDDKGLPDLPDTIQAAPSMKDFKKPLPEHEEHEEPIHSLPSFPDSPTKKGFSQTAIKDAVETEEEKTDLPTLPGEKEEKENLRMPPPPPTPTRGPRIIEMEEWKPTSLPHTSTMTHMPEKRVVENKPIFVRLDKFESARESLENVKEKLKEMDDLLRTIKEVKTKENEELSSWEKEIETIKARINSIGSEIFDSAIR